MNCDFLIKRISSLRKIKGVSEYQMSLELGQDCNYIENITAENHNLSISEFFALCKYFEITPSDFFDESIQNPILLRKLLNNMKSLNEDDMFMLDEIIQRLKKTK